MIKIIITFDWFITFKGRKHKCLHYCCYLQLHISYYRMVPIMPECNLLHYEDYLVSSRHEIRYKASFQGLIRLGEGLAHNWRLCSYDCFLLSWRYFFGPYPFYTQIHPRKIDLLNAFFHKISISKILFWSVYLVCATFLISKNLYLKRHRPISLLLRHALMPPPFLFSWISLEIFEEFVYMQKRI